MRVAATILLLLAIAWPSSAAERDRKISVGGAARSYTLITPEKQSEQLPMLIVYHGGGQTAKSSRDYTRFDEWADREKFVAVYPQGLGNNWNDGRISAGLMERAAANANDVEFTSLIIEQLVLEGLADPKRVFLTGASNGGMMAMYAGCELSGKVTGIAPVVANQPVDWRCRAERMPAIFIHGTLDEYMPFAGGQVAVKKTRRELGSVLSVEQTIALFKQMNSCTGVKESKRIDAHVRDETVAVVTEYECKEAPLKQIVIEGGGHTWPGARAGIIADWVLGRTSAEVSATAEIWNFFKALPPR